MYRKSDELNKFKQMISDKHGVDKTRVFPIINDCAIFEEAEIQPRDARLVAMDNMTLRFLKRCHQMGTKHRKCLMKDKRKREAQLHGMVSHAPSTIARSAWGGEHDEELVRGLTGQRSLTMEALNERMQTLEAENQRLRDGNGHHTYSDLQRDMSSSMMAGSVPVQHRPRAASPEGGRKDTRTTNGEGSRKDTRSRQMDAKPDPLKTTTEDHTGSQD